MQEGKTKKEKIQELFRVSLGVKVPAGPVAVTEGDEGEAHLVKAAEAVVRNVPAEEIVAHLIVIMALRPPLLRREAAEGRKVAPF